MTANNMKNNMTNKMISALVLATMVSSSVMASSGTQGMEVQNSAAVVLAQQEQQLKAFKLQLEKATQKKETHKSVFLGVEVAALLVASYSLYNLRQPIYKGSTHDSDAAYKEFMKLVVVGQFGGGAVVISGVVVGFMIAADNIKINKLMNAIKLAEQKIQRIKMGEESLLD